MTEQDGQIPSSYIEDKYKAEEMAHTENPYRVLIKNAKQAIDAGVTGMEDVLSELQSNMEGKVTETAEQYDGRQEKISEKKSKIAEKVFNSVRDGYVSDAQGKVAGEGVPLIQGDKVSNRTGEDDWLQRLHPDEFAEIRNVAFALTGLDSAPSGYDGFEKESSDKRIMSRIVATPTGLRLQEQIGNQFFGADWKEHLEGKALELPGSYYELSLLPPVVDNTPA